MSIEERLRKGVMFKVPGKPAGKARPRFNRKTGNVYSPDAGNFQARVAEHGMAAGLTDPQEGPFEVILTIKRLIPKSWSKKKKAAMANWPAQGKPDVVNVEAAVCDGLQGVAYHDDLQVTYLSTRRSWSIHEDSTTIQVRREEGGGDES